MAPNITIGIMRELHFKRLLANLKIASRDEESQAPHNARGGAKCG